MTQAVGPNNSPARLYGRNCTVDIGTQKAIRISGGLRVAFKILKTSKPEPNKSDVAIYNLTAAHRAQVEAKDTFCQLSAGYQHQSRIFIGRVTHAATIKEGDDWITKVLLADGFGARVSHYFAPGAKLEDVAKAIGQKLADDLGNLVDRVSKLSVQLEKGFSAHGSASVELTRLLEPHALEWSIQDGRIEVLASDEVVNGGQAPLLSPDTGLIGSPTRGSESKKSGPKPLLVRCLLHPTLRPGSLFKLESADAKGEFRCRRVVHVGDTHGPEWTTELEALPRS